MATAQQIIDRAARLASTLATGQTLFDDQKTTYLQLLNEMLDNWQNEGIDFGLDTLALTDEVYIDDADLLAVRYNLALLIGTDAGRPVRQDIFATAADLKTTLQAKYTTIHDMEMPVLFSASKRYDINNE